MTTIAEEFRSNGFVAVRGAVAPDVIRACVDVIGDRLRARSVDLRDPTTWTAPVVRVDCPEGPAFAAAGTSPGLAAMYDVLLGPKRWVHREGVGGTVPVRFPSATDPGDAGWHIDGSYDVNGQHWVNVHSRGRGLLALFLFTDVAESDAPTDATWPHRGTTPRIIAQPEVGHHTPFTLREDADVFPVERAILDGLG